MSNGSATAVQPTRRDAAKHRKRQQRERDRARMQADAAAAALRIEQHAETITPLSMRSPVLTGAGEMLVGARVQIVNGMPVRALAAGTMHDPIKDRGPRSAGLSELQRDAARELQMDWSDVGVGLGHGAADYLRSGGGGESVAPAGHMAMLQQIKTRARLDAALTHLGAFSPSIVRVALDAIPISVWGCSVGKTSDEAVAWIAAGLTRLAGFYWPQGRTNNSRVRNLTIGPHRSAYSTDVDQYEG